MANKLNPMVVRVHETDEVFTLEFSRESVKFAENRGFAIGEVGDFPMTKIPDLFFYAFRKNHRNIARSRTDEILIKDLGGLTKEHIERLIQLYAQPMEAIVRIEEDEESAKNQNATVEL